MGVQSVLVKQKPNRNFQWLNKHLPQHPQPLNLSVF